MKNKRKTILITIIVIFIVFMAGGLILDTVIGGACGNNILEKVSSPSGDQVAYVFVRDCGATTGYSPQLSILNKDENLENEGGNTFRSNNSFSIEWLYEKNLKVIYDKSSKTYEMDKRVNGIKIKYVGE
ncbi:hypothetical protein BACCIP111895_03738 [Neobacillus rhizosphaerae]|uniref:Uncharacterized protein n=1 Tax=Neobacillus rhizosphaerae TaxID=2880965 RepID=A0ABN8KRQ9_9BACI|nr:hypothetical protein [Neobacillus rhizosphaerae]CAH2716551.1 hypothetical protein BACCIP111895_03738 [Neobacillus rhizosphaerae]